MNKYLKFVVCLIIVIGCKGQTTQKDIDFSTTKKEEQGVKKEYIKYPKNYTLEISSSGQTDSTYILGFYYTSIDNSFPINFNSGFIIHKNGTKWWFNYAQKKYKEIVFRKNYGYSNASSNLMTNDSILLKDLVKVENPGITPIELNRDKKSGFVVNFEKIETPELKPSFINYKDAIVTTQLAGGQELAYVPNKLNDLMEMNIIFDMGSDHDKKLSLAVNYLKYLGTDTMTPEEVSQEFYKLGVEYGVTTRNDQTIIYLKGLRENLDKGLVLLEDLWNNAQSDQEAYDKYVLSIAKSREDTKANKRQILWNGLYNYGVYGENSRLRDIFTIAELKAMNPEELVNIVKDLKNYKHRFFYYGKDVTQAKTTIANNHKVGETKPYPVMKKYIHKETGDNVYFVNYDMVQAELLFLSKGDTFNPKQMAASRLFNTYFGSGLSSIVFQELRESKSLAYSAFARYRNATKAGDPNYTYAYIGTQANKLNQAVESMLELMNNMPEAEDNFNAAKESTLKKLAAERTDKTDIFWSYERMKKRGITENNKEEIYNSIQNMSLTDLSTFFNENIKNGTYDVMVVGNKNDVDLNALTKLGEVQEMNVDYLFNYETPMPIKN